MQKTPEKVTIFELKTKLQTQILKLTGDTRKIFINICSKYVFRDRRRVQLGACFCRLNL